MAAFAAGLETEANMADKLRWGFLGTGGIARRVAGGLKEAETAELAAVASRTSESARRFAEVNGAARSHEGYDDLLRDPGVDAVYVALPNHMHREWAVRCARAGKHILCEKPLGCNRAEAADIVEAARGHDVFLMEAFMYRTYPHVRKLVELIGRGEIGRVRLIETTFCYSADMTGNIRAKREMAGGSIMDVGCYAVSAARLVAGAGNGCSFSEPLELSGCAVIPPEWGVDAYAVASVRFDGDIIAHLACGIQVAGDSAVNVYGSEGVIRLKSPWLPNSPRLALTVQRGNDVESVPLENAKNVYAVELDTVARYLEARQAPSPCMTWADSLGNMAALDRWRKSIGLTFPQDA